MADTALTSKIGLFGLDNAGKTTIIKVLQGERDLNAIVHQKPTLGVERNSITGGSENFVLHDFGGQASFRRNYFKAPRRHFNQMSLLIFVIDIQDTERHDVALKYLERSLKTFLKYGIEKHFLVLLHKADVGYVEDPQVQITLKFLEEKVQLICDGFQVAPNLRRSTIYDDQLKLDTSSFTETSGPAATALERLNKIVVESKDFHKTVEKARTGADSSGTARHQTIQALSLERKKMIAAMRELLQRKTS